ncbi:ABC transporter substrate-binding protein [Dactylosporangium sp. NBC_01737]|uniref:ABC transporter substrate-binding protein n=1 Tax=Dactylosporangium sp. NBC_01737 TaxID=2975959 RepID=UPI002E120FB3|nr:ABC transporter substrate-binding protein [Dactylosporangium sp. NBC_01737]
MRAQPDGRQRWRRSRRGITATAAAFTLLVAGCAQHTDSGTTNAPVKIGMVTALSGPLQSIGEELRAGFQLYLDTHGGKLGGHLADLVVADEGDGPATAGPAAEKLVKQDRVLAVTGVVNAAALQSVASKTTPARIPLVGSCGRPTTLPDVSWVWHTSWISTQFGKAIAAYVKSKVDGPVFAIGPDYQGGKDQVEGFTTAFTALGGELTDGKATYTPYPGTTNWVPYLSKVRNSGAKAVYAFYAGKDAIGFVKQYKELGLTDIPLYGAGALTEGQTLTAQGPAALGVQTVAPYAVDLDNAANRAFVDAYQQKFGKAPSYNAMISWDAAAVLDRAIGAASPNGANPTPAAVNDAIGNLGQIDSPRGTWQFSAKSHVPAQKWYLRTVRQDGANALANVTESDLTVLDD